MGHILSDIKIGIIGCGRIGSIVKTKLKKLGVKNIFCYDIDKNKKKLLRKSYKSLNFIQKNSDLITLHIPMNKKNKNFINDGFINKCKKKPFLVNTSRGLIINEISLIKALKSNRVKAVALDVYQNEPNINKRLLKFSSSIFTSHIAAMTTQARQLMELQCVESIIKFINGKQDKRRVI